MVVGMMLTCWACASALDPSLDISQYAHTAWRVRDGFTQGYVNAIAQTPDGYLWLATELGLVRFDGVRPVPWRPPAGQQLPDSFIGDLLVSRDGTLWIGTSKGLSSWNNGKLTTYSEFNGHSIGRLLQDREGTLWVGVTELPSAGRLCAFQNGKFQCQGGDGAFGAVIYRPYEDSRGNLWFGVQDGLWRWKPGRPQFFAMPKAGAVSFGEDEQPGLLIGVQGGGLRRLIDGRVEPYILPGAPKGFFMKMLRDRDGGLWIATIDRGLLHIHHGKTDRFSQANGLSGDDVIDLFEDREGNVWVATSNGLDRFREYAVPNISIEQGLSNAVTDSVLASKDGSVWIGTASGLNRWRSGQISVLEKLNRSIPGSLFQDSSGRIWVSTGNGEFGYVENERFVPMLRDLPTGLPVNSIVELAPGHLWLAHQNAGLFHVSEGRVIHQIHWAELGHKDFAWGMAADPTQRGIWLGFIQGGIAYVVDGRVSQSYSAADGLGAGLVSDLRFDSRGVLWATTAGGLSRIEDGRISTLTSKNGLPCDSVHWMMEDDYGSAWLYLPCGLVRIARSELDAWVANPTRAVKATVFDISDGVRSHAQPGAFSQRVTKSPDGKLWFMTWDGISLIDPKHLAFNKLPPPVHIEQIIADGKTYDVTSDASSRLPPLVRNLEVDYTALSLVAPEKVFFRYKLDGWDSDWQDARTRRQAFYSNLPPRRYIFRVMASNNSGVWNEAGAFLAFSIAPAYYQTTWFALSCAAALLALFYAFYRLRLREQTRQFNIRLEERVNERTRIARDFHDTLLQSFQGVMMKFFTLTYFLDRPAEARQRLEGFLEEGQQAIIEGRDALRGMRSSTVIKNDLACALTLVGERLAAEQNAQNPIDFRVVVEGESRDLHPILRDEVYRIAGEGVRNAFHHSGATRIEVGIFYDERQLRARVLDNGKGIDPKVLGGGGRQGHYGLPGMQERAKLVGGKLTVRSRLNSGTEVELTIPASRAYVKSSAPR